MAVKYPITLSVSEPNNNIGLLKIRQADEETQTLVVQILEDAVPKSYEGLQVFFCARIGQTAGLGVIEQKLNMEEMTNPKVGQLEYTFRAEDWQVLGRQTGYFSFRKMTDDHTYVQQFSTRDFTYEVTKSIYSDGIKEVKKDGSTYVWTIEDLKRLYEEYIASGKSDWEEFVEQNKEILESVDPGGKILTELIAARSTFSSLGERLDIKEIATEKQLVDNLQNINSRALNVKFPPIPLTAAKGDGTTDDTQAIQNILNLLKSNQTLIIPDGIFRVRNLVIPNQWGVKIEFRGLLRAIEGGDTDYLVATENYVSNIAEAGQAITLINPRIDGNNIVKNGLVIQTWNTLIERPDIINCQNGLKITAETRNGTKFSSSTLVNNIINHPNIHNNSNYGIWVRDPDRNRVTDYFVLGGFSYSNKIGLYLESFAGALIEGVHTYANSERSIYISIISVGGRIANSYFEDTEAIDIADAIANQFITLQGNAINGAVRIYAGTENTGINSVGNIFKTAQGKFIQKWGSTTIYSTNDKFQAADPYVNIGNDGAGTSEAPNVFFVRNSNSSGIGLRRTIEGIVQFGRINTVEYGSGQPTAGTYRVGDKVIVRAPVADGYAEYICTQAGSPGIWKGKGRLSV